MVGTGSAALDPLHLLTAIPDPILSFRPLLTRSIETITMNVAKKSVCWWSIVLFFIPPFILVILVIVNSAFWGLSCSPHNSPWKANTPMEIQCSFDHVEIGRQNNKASTGVSLGSPVIGGLN